MYFCINEFEVGVNDSIFSGDEQQKVYNIGILQSSFYHIKMADTSGPTFWDILDKYRGRLFSSIQNL